MTRRSIVRWRVAAVVVMGGALCLWPARHAVRHSLAAWVREAIGRPAIEDVSWDAQAGDVMVAAVSGKPPAGAPLVRPVQAKVKGNTFVVSPTGDDANAGTDKAPFRTLQKAADAVHAGDTVLIRAGTYGAGMNFINRAGGTEDAPISFLADEGVILTHCATSGVNADLAGINIEGMTGGTGWIVIQGFHIISDGSMQRGGIRVTGSDHTQVLDNVVEKAFIGIFSSNSKGLLLQHNTCANSTDQHGIYVSRNSQDYVVRGNILHDNHWDGLHTNAINGAPNDGGLVENNVSYHNELCGMDVEGTTHTVFRNNILFDNGKHGIVLHNQDQADTPACAGNVFVNNTFADNGMFAIQIAVGGNARNTFFNNILMSKNRIYGSIGIGGPADGLVSDYNAVADNFSTDLGRSALSLAAWRTQTHQDQHSIIATPPQLFVDAAKGDFHLRSGSPAIGAGIAKLGTVDVPRTDAGDHPRVYAPAPAPSVGALEP